MASGLSAAGAQQMARVNGKAPGGRGIWPIVAVGSFSVSRRPPEPKVRNFVRSIPHRDYVIVPAAGLLILGFLAHPTGGGMAHARVRRFLRADRVHSCGKGHNTYPALRP